MFLLAGAVSVTERRFEEKMYCCRTAGVSNFSCVVPLNSVGARFQILLQVLFPVLGAKEKEESERAEKRALQPTTYLFSR
jgi:hypothetical protein